MEEYQPLEMLMWLLANPGVEALLEVELDDSNCRTVHLLLNAVLVAQQSGRSDTLTVLLVRLRDSNLFKSISQFLNSVEIIDQNTEELVDKMISLMELLMKTIPTDSKNFVNLLVLVFESKIFPLLGSSKGILVDALEKVKELVQETKKNDVETKKPKIQKEDEDNIEPPDDFRQISIFPTVVDLNNNTPFLRRNLIGKAYKDTDAYLDVQFRLLREDFVRPLREGIASFKDGLTQGVQIGKSRNKDIRVYHDARVLSPDITPQGIIHHIQFSMEGLKGIRWENSKRLIFGSLVCLSNDNFHRLYFATIANRDAKNLQEGRIDVIFQDEELVPTLGDVFVMVESSSYFEAYRHVLKSLQKTTEESLPFKRYIVGERKEKSIFDEELDEEKEETVVPHYPRYLLAGARYDLTPLMKEDCQELGKAVAVCAEKRWPGEDMLALDTSQLEAVQHALTREVAVVQGPPGTGKTFIGLKVAEVLLLNHKVWNKNSGPILVLCYTNHALDQFLEGILKFHNSEVVRVGSRSKCEALEPFNLSNVLRKAKQEKKLPRDVHVNRCAAWDSMKKAEDEILNTGVRIEAAYKHVLDENELGIVITSKALEMLIEGHEEKSRTEFQVQGRKASAMAEWLGLGNFDTVRLVEQVDDLEIDVVENNEEDNADIEVDLDAQFEQSRRVLEEDEDVMDYLKKLEMKRRASSRNINVARFLENDVNENQNNDFNDDWQISKKEKKRRMINAKNELRKLDCMGENERKQAERMVWNLSPRDRWRLYRTWREKYVEIWKPKILENRAEYVRNAKMLSEVKEMEKLHVLKSAKVVGMTTTGAARLHSILHHLKPTIIIAEEAAEVLEAHIVASLTASCQHLILIGDHQQLRPNPTVYDLCRNYNLDVSLFERLIKSGLAYDRLEKQHRMLPAISRLLTPHIYTELVDHESVKKYPMIKGVSSNMFFVSHNQQENSVQDGHSKVVSLLFSY